MKFTQIDSFETKRTLIVNGYEYSYYSLIAAGVELGLISNLPFTLKILLENLLRYEDSRTVTTQDCEAVVAWLNARSSDCEISYRPTRVLMQDFTGVPAVVDLAAMRDAMKKVNDNPQKINPLSRVDLVIDHSVQVDRFGNNGAVTENMHLEMERNQERYKFLKWAQESFHNFHVVPPGTGICHQVNLEYLAKVVWQQNIEGETYIFPDTLVGTDSHTTMINGLGVLGWGVGGIEAEAAMLGQPISMLIPEVIGFRLKGQLREGVTATDLVLTVTQILRTRGVVGKFVEFFGSGLVNLPLADRATLANMAPEYGATCGFFPVDQETLNYLRLTGRDEQSIAVVEAYAKAQGLWFDETSAEPDYTDILELDLANVEPSLAGPKRPQDRVALQNVPEAFNKMLTESQRNEEKSKSFAAPTGSFDMHHGDVVIAAITSCTNTSNPSVLMAAGLVAKKAIERGLKTKPWVKTSLAPGSQVVTDYLKKAGLQKHLDQLGFQLVGYGCTTCIGNSGPLPEAIATTIQQNELITSAVLSGNRNFEGRIHPQVKANWLASPPLVVAYALAGTVNIDLAHDPIGEDAAGKAVYLRDIWPTNHEIAAEVAKVDDTMFRQRYADVFKGDESWANIQVKASDTYSWDNQSTYIKNPPYFDYFTKKTNVVIDILQARVLAVLGDSITTDHISPAGSIKVDSPAGKYLIANHVKPEDFNSYGARRGNHEAMMRGTFANIRIRNEMLHGIEGGITKLQPSGEVMPIYDAAMHYIQQGTPLVIIAGKEYGTGSSRDWAAKGTSLLGVRAVIAESFERIHRSNLIGMGVVPLEFKPGEDRKTLGIKGDEIIDIIDLATGLKPRMEVTARIHRPNGGKVDTIKLLCRIDTLNELEYYQHGGILPYVLRQLMNQ